MAGAGEVSPDCTAPGASPRVASVLPAEASRSSFSALSVDAEKSAFLFLLPQLKPRDQLFTLVTKCSFVLTLCDLRLRLFKIASKSQPGIGIMVK